MTFKGIDLTGIIGALITIVGMLLARAQSKLADAKAQDAAYVRLGVIGLTIVADLWKALDEEYRQDMLDGNLDRSRYEKIIEAAIEKYTSRAELEKLAVAAKLPLPGIIAWLVEFAIDRILAAHNPGNVDVQKQQYAVDTEVYDPTGTGG